MAVDDELASQWLEAVLYYRLSAYWYPLRRVDTEEHVEDGFVPGADFADVVALYEADRNYALSFMMGWKGSRSVSVAV